VNRAAGTALFVISTTVLVIRFLARWLIKGTSIGWDDAMIAVAWAGIVPSTVFVDIMIHHGMGRDIWTVDPSGITLMLKLFYYEQYIYQTIIVSTKISIVLLYLRLFPASVSQRLQYVCWGVIAALVAYFLGFVIYFAVECRPIVSSHSPGRCQKEANQNRSRISGFSGMASTKANVPSPNPQSTSTAPSTSSSTSSSSSSPSPSSSACKSKTRGVKPASSPPSSSASSPPPAA
jgi:hypothetical protein